MRRCVFKFNSTNSESFMYVGIKICGGCSLDGEELNGVFIKRILPGGLAETQGMFVVQMVNC